MTITVHELTILCPPMRCMHLMLERLPGLGGAGITRKAEHFIVFSSDRVQR
jgi:hypothetical protein